MGGSNWTGEMVPDWLWKSVLWHVYPTESRVRDWGRIDSSEPVCRRATTFVLGGGAVAATLNILYAWLFWRLKAGVSMQRILQSVAAGVLGRSSFDGGTSTATLGLVLHYFMASVMSVGYYLATDRWPLLVERPALCGAAYGLLLYAVMNAIVAPLSAAGQGPAVRLWIVLSIVVHMVCIGTPIGLAAERARSA